MSKEVERKVFLDELPKRGNFVDWERSTGYNIKFIYGNIEGEVRIVDYDGKYLYIKYLDKDIFKIVPNSFKNCFLGKLLGTITNSFKVKIGANFKDDKRDLTVIDKEYRIKYDKNNNKNNYKYYKYKCNKCGWTEGWMIEGSLLRGSNCACCCTPTRAVVEGINDIPTTAPWMVKYFQGGYEEAKMYTKSSNQKIYPICPDCGKVKNKEIKISDIYNEHSIFCSCGDGMSYPNKFMFNILDQLNVDFINEYTPDWIKPKRYDFYFKLNNKEYIVEMDGRFHKISKNKEIDKYKDKKAIKHNIKLIRIDSQESDLKFIKNNILNSELANLFDLSKVDWLKCEEFALSNLVKKACELKRYNPDMTANDIGKIMDMDCSTIREYLKRGNLLRWCTYNPKEESIKSGKMGTHNQKSIEIFKNNESLGIFKSARELERESENLFGIKLSNKHISSVCKGKRKQHKGFTFKYEDKQ